MSITLADPEIHRQIAALIQAHHPELARAEVTVNALLTSAVIRGWTTTTVTPPKMRAMLPVDAVITIDRERWTEATEPQRAAMLDQALARLQVVLVLKRDDAGKVVMSGGEQEKEAKRDEHDRPKLKTRAPSFVIEVYEECATRHGPDSVEAAQCREFAETEAGQLVMFDREGVPAKLGAKVETMKAARMKRRNGREPSDLEVMLGSQGVGVASMRRGSPRRPPDTPPLAG